MSSKPAKPVTTLRKYYAADFKRLKGELDAASDVLTNVQGKAPTAPTVAATTQCGGGTDKRTGRHLPTYACQNKQGEAEAQAYSELVKAHDADLHKAEDARAKAQTALDALTKPNPDTVRTAERALEHAAHGSTMYRVAASWFGVPVKDLTDAQFERFKRLAIVVVAGSAATATMIVSFVSHAVPRDPGQKDKLVRAIRAYFARKRKDVVRTVVKTVEKPVEKIVKVEKHVFVDRPTVVEKPVPGPERIIVKHIHVPVDISTGRVVNRDGTLGEEIGLRTVQGGKQ